MKGKIGWLVMGLGLVSACRYSDRRRPPVSEVVALVVRSEPPGAEVRVHRIEGVWTTPCEIADGSIRRGFADLTLSLEGYETVMRRVAYDGETPVEIDVRLSPRTGTLRVREISPGAAVLLLRSPESLRDPATVALLFSQDEASLRSALERLDPADARLVVPRLSELAERGPEPLRPLAREMGRPPVAAPESVGVAFQGVADLGGEARFSGIPISWDLLLLVTGGGAPDFVRTGLKADYRRSVTIAPPRAVTPLARAPAQAQAKIALKGAGDRIRVSAGGKVVADVTTKPDEVVRLTVPREKVLVELLDSRTGMVVHAFEMVPEGETATPGTPDDRLGKVQLVHRNYGVFVKLEPGQDVGLGEVLAIYREGREIGRVKVVKVYSADGAYPSGSAQIAREGLVLHKGDEARRVK